MNKKIVSLLVCMLMFVAFSTVNGTEIYDEDEIQSNIHQNPTSNRDMWDVKFQYDVGGDTGSLYLVGTAFDGNYFYCPEFNSATIYRVDKDGTYVDSINVGVNGLIDLTYDGEYVYGATQGTPNTIYIMDMEEQVQVGTISAPHAAWNIAYDADADSGNGGFWIGQWDQAGITLIDRSGNVLDSFSPPESVLGMAWDPYTEIDGYNGPFLWIFTGTSTGVDGIIKVVDLDTKTLVSEVSQNVADDLGAGIAGGLCMTSDWEEGVLILYGLVQGADPLDDYIFGYEMTILNSPPETPSEPGGPSEGVVTLEYDFTASTIDPDEDMISYGWDFNGDFVVDEWTDLIDSGDTCEVTYSWDDPGTYNIRVKAKDSFDHESDWSAPHEITIIETPDLSVISIGGSLFKLNAELINNGPVDANDVSWSINLDGGLIILGGSSSGTINIPAGQLAEISTGLILGFGSTTVRVNLDHPLSSASKSKQVFVLGILFL